MRDRAGATGINLASFYHSGRFLHPHNPKRRIAFLRSGTVYYRPGPNAFLGCRIRPNVWPVLDERAFWPELWRELERREMELSAWCLGMHNSGIGMAYPDVVAENAYGDRILTDLCPSHPDVRAFMVALVGDIAASTRASRIILESLEFMPFEHGYHHELVGVPTGPTVDFLMSLCFCPSCLERGRQAGVDMAAVRRWVREQLDTHFADPFAGRVQMGWPELRQALGGEFGAFLDLRQTILTSLLAEIREAVQGTGVRLALLDFGPLYPMGADGSAWENGVNLAQQLPLVDEIHPTMYFTDMGRLAQQLELYRRMVGDRVPMVPAIRAILPETPSEERLMEQLRPLAPYVEEFTFYNYGIMALQTLDWIGRATKVLGK